MKYYFVALFCGALFGAGLSLAHMVNPDKVLGFLDVTGNWDPSLLFVMAGALPVAMVTFRWILKRPAPILDDNFQLTGKISVDKALVFGAAIFGVGWGMSGYCPGPAISGLGLGSLESLLMVITIYAGIFTYNAIFGHD
ncbi:MAG: DUF6691 family protein [Methylococcaceae bacterium]